MKNQNERKRYPSNLTDKQWEIIKPLLPPSKNTKEKGGRPRTADLREILNAIFYITRTGCQWSMLPTDFPPSGTVYWYFSQWKKNGTWKKIHDALAKKVRVRVGKKWAAESWNH